MISHLPRPSVCVIDDEPADYEPILKALGEVGLGVVHVKGDRPASLPKRPFPELRLVFLDLHLSGQVGKAAASHTANVFSKVVAADTAPAVVVIWSKYGSDVPEGGGGETEADLFKQALLAAVPGFSERLVFLEMPKPKPEDRPTARKWVAELKKSIAAELGKVPGFDALWAWESMVRKAGAEVTKGLTTLALGSAAAGGGAGLVQGLDSALRCLVREQGGHGCSPESAAGHLASVLGQSLVDHVEHSGDRKGLARHGKWLSEQDGLPKVSKIGPAMNGFLLTASIVTKAGPFSPGTVYHITPSKVRELFGASLDDIVCDCCRHRDGKVLNTKGEAWKQANPAHAVLIELSPACDVHQGKRRCAFLVGGLVLPSGAREGVQRADGIEMLEPFAMRWPKKDFAEQDVVLVCLSYLKLTMQAAAEPRWMRPWFRLRELPTARLRNWHSSHAARVGYVAL